MEKGKVRGRVGEEGEQHIRNSQQLCPLNKRECMSPIMAYPS